MAARLHDILRVAATFGIRAEKPGRGSHWKFRKDGFRTYPVPAHNGEKAEIDDRYLKGLCRNFQIDLDAFRAKL
jgi:predicted RNA binding protein YcfA (HicA-like mRNA interferase family)